MNRYKLQSYALLALNRVPRRLVPHRIPLAVPLCMLNTGGGAISHIYKEIFVFGAYESPEPVAKGARILDAGAHIGLASMYFLHRYPGATLTTIEANPATADVVQQNLAPWGSRVHLIKAALSDQDGEASFFVTTDNPVNVNASMTNRNTGDAAVTELRVKCLDVAHLFESGGFAFAKIDIEGGEYQVLKFEKFSPETVRAMVIEFHDLDTRRHEFREIVDLLVERGYAIRDLQGRNLSPDALDRLGQSVLLRIEHRAIRERH